MSNRVGANPFYKINYPEDRYLTPYVQEDVYAPELKGVRINNGIGRDGFYNRGRNSNESNSLARPFAGLAFATGFALWGRSLLKGVKKIGFQNALKDPKLLKNLVSVKLLKGGGKKALIVAGYALAVKIGINIFEKLWHGGKNAVDGTKSYFGLNENNY